MLEAEAITSSAYRPSHRQLCRHVAAHLLKAPWCWLATFEVSIPGGFADVLAISDPAELPVNDEHERTHRAYEAARAQHRRGKFHAKEAEWDRINAQADERWPLRSLPALAGRYKVPHPRVTVVEVKRTRADLLADLRSGKLLKYEATGSHCYLAATDVALGARVSMSGTTKADYARWTTDLTHRGLPKHWGVLFLAPWRSVKGLEDPVDTCAIHTVRRPRAIKPTTVGELYRLQGAIARSLCYRVVRGEEAPR